MHTKTNNINKNSQSLEFLEEINTLRSFQKSITKQPMSTLELNSKLNDII